MLMREQKLEEQMIYSKKLKRERERERWRHQDSESMREYVGVVDYFYVHISCYMERRAE